MQDQNTGNVTLGSAIDQMLEVLKQLDETSRRTALKAVCDQLGIGCGVLVQQASSGAGSGESLQPSTGVPPASTTPRDIRAFAQEKAPSSAIERAVLVAYYLAELAPPNERKESINKEDLIKYFKQAKFALPKRPEQTLVNARHAGYLDPVGEGQYRLNAVGHNLIALNLPRKGGQQERARHRTSRKRGAPQRRASK